MKVNKKEDGEVADSIVAAIYEKIKDTNSVQMDTGSYVETTNDEDLENILDSYEFKQEQDDEENQTESSNQPSENTSDGFQLVVLVPDNIIFAVDSEYNNIDNQDILDLVSKLTILQIDKSEGVALLSNGQLAELVENE